MKPIAKINCKINDVYYEKGDEIQVDSKEALIKLNRMGFIEPLTPKQIQEWTKEPVFRKFNKEEE